MLLYEIGNIKKKLSFIKSSTQISFVPHLCYMLL